MNVRDFIDIEKTLARELLLSAEYPWEALELIAEYIARIGPRLDKSEFVEARRGVWIAKSADIAASAQICGPAIIGEGAEVRHGAYIRGGVIIGKGATVGNSTEIKNSILSDEVQVPHYNYVGDSVLGYRAHLGAGAVISNLKSDKSNVCTYIGDEKIDTGRRKFGALVGDGVEVGCGSVLCPGTVIGRRSTVYPLSRVRGFVAENSIYKGEGRIVRKEHRG